MKRSSSTLIAFVLTATAFSLIPPNARALDVIDEVDVDDPASETGHDLRSCGPVEPATHGGGWGGAASGIPEDEFFPP